MKNIKDIFESKLDLDETVMTDYQVGQSVRFILKDVAAANPKATVTDDSGDIIKKSGENYVVKLHINDQEVKVTGAMITSFGDSADHGTQDTTGPGLDGQV